MQDSGAKILIAHTDLAQQLDEQKLPEVLVAVFPTPAEVAKSYHIDINAPNRLTTVPFLVRRILNFEKW